MIKKAAIKYNNNIYSGKTHSEINIKMACDGICDAPYNHNSIEGFVDDKNNFMSRKEALQHAIDSGQVNPDPKKRCNPNLLFSEDLKKL